MELCPCGSNAAYGSCCLPLIRGKRSAETAEQLMRSRYTAYVKKEMDYILTSIHPDSRAGYDEKSSRAWAEKAEWHGIRILKTVKGRAGDGEGQVEFIVSYRENGLSHEHHELSSFKKEGQNWYFTSGKTMPAMRSAAKTGRNDPCPCGSGKKFKKCCGQ